jgi:hypothetical protein
VRHPAMQRSCRFEEGKQGEPASGAELGATGPRARSPV